MACVCHHHCGTCGYGDQVPSGYWISTEVVILLRSFNKDYFWLVLEEVINKRMGKVLRMLLSTRWAVLAWPIVVGVRSNYRALGVSGQLGGGGPKIMGVWADR